jgi:hypothetical protein
MTDLLRSLVALFALWNSAASLMAADVVVNQAQTFQTIEGWGHGGGVLGGTAGASSFLAPAVADAVNYQYLDYILDDLGLTGTRTWEVGPRIDGTGNDHGDCDVVDWNLFEGDTFSAADAAYLLYFQNRILAKGCAPSFYSSPGYPTHASDVKPWVMNHPGERAQQIWASALYLKNTYGININSAVIYNEPSIASSILADDIKALGPRFAAQGLPTLVQYAEAVAPQTDWTYITPVQNDPDMWPFVGRISYHNYGTADPYRSYLRDYAKVRGITTAQTEMGNPNFDDLYSDLTLGGVSYWEVAFSPNATLSPNAGLTAFTPTSPYFRLRQVMHYIRPGAVRIGTASSDPSVRVLSFATNGQVTAIIENTSGSAQTVNLSGLPAGTYGLSRASAGVIAFQELGLQTVGASGTLTLNVNGGSAVTTLYPYSGPNRPPTIMTWGSSPGYVVAPANTATLSVTANDPELDPLTYHWSVTSQPAGANALLGASNAASTTVSGLTVAGTYVFNVDVQDGVNTSSKQVYLVVYDSNPQPVLGQTGFRIAAPYGLVFGDPSGTTHAQIELPTSSATLQVGISDLANSDFTGRGQWSVVSQPAGANVSLGATTYIFVSIRAIVSGMTVPGDYVFQVNVTNPGHPDLTAQIICTVSPASSAPVISSITASPASSALPVSATQLSAVTSGSPNQTLRHWWAVKTAPGGARPLFDHQGTANTTVSNLVLPGSYTFTLRAFDDIHMTAQDKTVIVSAAPGAPVITSAAATSVIVGAPFTYTITASNAPGSFNAAGLPPGFSVNTNTGVISGTPATAGTFNIQTSATNASGTGYGNLALTVNLPLPAFISAPNAGGLINTAFSCTIQATNAATNYTATGLPAGLALNAVSGAITGTPTTAGTYSVSIGATNTTGTTNGTLTIVIYNATPPAPVITSALNATATAGLGFNYSITATNNPTGYFAIGLPAGLIFDPAGGGISGTPSVTGTFSVTIRAGNSGGTGGATLALTVNTFTPQPPIITSALTASGTVGTAFSYATTAINNPASFNATGLPAGLSVNTTNGLISGTPSAAGTFSVTLSATNAQGTGTATLSLTIVAGAVPVITSPLTSVGTAGVAFGYTITASNNPTGFNAAGLPPGLSINPSTGIISGTALGQGVWDVTLIAGNPAGSSATIVTFTINSAADAGLVGSWKLDAGSGMIALDLSGNANDGTLANGPVWTNGKVRGALVFNGSNSYVNVLDTISLQAAQVTLSAWMNSLNTNPSGGAQQSIIAKDDGVQRAFNLKIAGGKIQLAMSYSTTAKAVSGTTALLSNTWYFVAGTYDGATLKVYVNGVLEASLAASLPAGWDNAQPLAIGGRSNNSPAVGFNGTVDEVRMYSRALSQAEIQALMTPSPFDAWLAGNFTVSELATEATSGAEADPDHDGLANLVEFALNHNPKQTDGNAFTSQIQHDPGDGNDYLTITFTQLKTPIGFSYHVEVSDDLAIWNEGTGFTQQTQATDDGNGLTQTVTARAITPVSLANRKFIRLRISQP